MPRRYLYISDRKVEDILSEVPMEASRKTAIKLGINVGFLTSTVEQSGSPSQIRESRQARLLVAEDRLRRFSHVMGPLDVSSDGEWFGYRMRMTRGWHLGQALPGMWFGGITENRAIVMAGSEIHSMGPRPEEESDAWMSDLPPQIEALTRLGRKSMTSQHDDGISNVIGAAIAFSRGAWGGVQQDMEYVASANSVIDVPATFDSVDTLIMASPLYVALVG